MEHPRVWIKGCRHRFQTMVAARNEVGRPDTRNRQTRGSPRSGRHKAVERAHLGDRGMLTRKKAACKAAARLVFRASKPGPGNARSWRAKLFRLPRTNHAASAGIRTTRHNPSAPMPKAVGPIPSPSAARAVEQPLLPEDYSRDDLRKGSLLACILTTDMRRLLLQRYPPTKGASGHYNPEVACISASHDKQH